jgi:hypothetical protein
MTWQVKDIIIFENCSYYLNDNLLDKYFQEFVNRRPKFNIIDTACWRGHVIHFEVVEKELLIKQIYFSGENDNVLAEKVIAKYFPKRKFEWFSGLLRIDNFKGDFNEEENENSIFEFLEFKSGTFLNYWKFSFKEFEIFKTMLFQEFQKLSEFQNMFLKIKEANPKARHDDIEKMISDKIIKVTNENYLKMKLSL